MLEVDHIGYAVRDIAKAVAAMNELGYIFSEPAVNDYDRNLKICFGQNGAYRVELLAPLTKDKTPVDTLLRKVGPTPYHICYRSRNFEQDVREFHRGGVHMLAPPAPAIAFGGKRVVFLLNNELGIIEILEN